MDCPVRLNLSARLINHDTVFFSHNKTASAGLSVAKTISRTASRSLAKKLIHLLALCFK
jgi:hypothetical protein